MQVRDMKQRSVDVHDFSMIPRADIPRSQFKMEKTLKTAFSFSDLVPILCEEVLPGDTWNASMTTVARTAVPIAPIMDNWHMEFFAFFVPNRLVWDNWQRFMGEQPNPSSSIAFTIPIATSPINGYAIGSLGDYFGLPTAGTPAVTAAFNHSALPLRAYYLIYNEWFRDENLQDSYVVDTGDGPDSWTGNPLQRGVRHDYFRSALPWPQKGNTAVTLPLGTRANISGLGFVATNNAAPSGGSYRESSGATVTYTDASATQTAGGLFARTTTGVPATAYPDIYADLSTATAATINQLRQSFQIQKLLERDARGGTRYTEIVRSHFGVVSPDARLQRPEFIGGGRAPILTNAIPQTSATGLTGGTTPAGSLAATGHAQGHTGFTYSATEHGHIIMLANARADITYSQGLRKMWSRSTRYDFYFPVFAMLGEQAILNRELYCTGSGFDSAVFGYQERWAEYRYNPSQITGIMRPSAAGTLAYWHSSQLFGSLPTLNSTFITDDSKTVLNRNFVNGSAEQGQQLICDFFYVFKVARPLPMYSVPGLIDHF